MEIIKRPCTVEELEKYAEILDAMRLPEDRIDLTGWPVTVPVLVTDNN